MSNNKNNGNSTKNNIKPISTIGIAILFGGVVYLFYTLATKTTGFSLIIPWLGMIIFAFLSLYLLVFSLPECGIKRILLKIIGYPLSILISIVELGQTVYTIIITIFLVFITPLFVYSVINKLFNVVLADKAIYFISFFLTLVILTYAKKVFIGVMRLLHLPKSIRKEASYKKAVEMTKKIPFRAITYVIGFLVYFISVMENFIGYPIINIEWWIGTKDVALEGLIAYLALDSCISEIQKLPGKVRSIANR